MATTRKPAVRIPVFYTPKQDAPASGGSPSAAKPAKVVASWKQKRFPIEVLEPAPATIEELCLAHDATYVRDVLACRVANGFGNRSPAVAASLPYTTGSMLSAARHVLKHGGAAASPTSGFHHAGYDHGSGYCTFNALMVTAFALRAEGARRVGAIDLDCHFGNGTEDIIKRFDAANFVPHFTAGRDYHRASQAAGFLDALPTIIGETAADCDVVLFQAGADPHVSDPLGGWLTTDQLRQRDAIVFDELKRLGVSVVFCLAGGYQVEKDGSIPAVLEIHDHTMRECVRVNIGALAATPEDERA